MIPTDLLSRLTMVLVMMLAGLASYMTYNGVLSRRVAQGLLDELGIYPAGTFLIVYFSMPTLDSCKTIQRSALKNFVDLMEGAVQVLEIDTSKRPDLANRWGVLSIPTTLVIAPNGKIRFINQGVANAEKLLMQIYTPK